ncbi:Threonine/homoserine efflux transporter RhtA [Albimonas donghaensis]|uniref:Threonine/homoserine efflux transporter RhtA n=2 Tax=Albimonas donghaensis TaxID=356660 RepID=A0A1H3A004_9RHOB|nr:Threonine/homoserine efflux transporter RhtA [Albimonas donghaensis]
MASRLDNASGRGVPHPPSASVAPGFVLNARMPRPVPAGVEHGVVAMTLVLRFPFLSFRGAAGVDPGMIFMTAAMLLLPVGDTLSKLLAAEMDPLAVTLFRLLAQGAFLLPAAALLHGRGAGFAFTRGAVLSGCLVAGMLASLISAFAVMPIATAIAIFFVEPLLLTLLAGPLLGEPPGPRRLAAVAVGLLGALVVIRPGGADFGPAMLLPLIAATCYALNMVVLRKAGAHTPVLNLQCGATLVAAGISLLAVGALATFGDIRLPLTTLPGWSWWAIAGSGLCAALSFALIGEAFRRTEARTLAPFQYLEILGATAMGFLVFGDFPDAATWLGVAIILGSGLYIVQRERRIHRPPAPRAAGRS